MNWFLQSRRFRVVQKGVLVSGRSWCVYYELALQSTRFRVVQLGVLVEG
jgi:hypothetical protein